MGTFYVQMEIGDPSGERFESIEALVDTGAAYSFMPPSLLRRLEVVPHTKRRFVMADGSLIQRDVAQTWVRLHGERGISPVVFGDENATPLLGAVTLEIFALGIDPLGERLFPRDDLLMGTQAPRP